MAFKTFKLEDGLFIDRSSCSFPYVVRGFSKLRMSVPKIMDRDGQPYTHFVIVQSGKAMVKLDRYQNENGQWIKPDLITLGSLCVAVYTTGFKLIPVHSNGPCSGMVISRLGANRALQTACVGPLEKQGRLQYVDGCSDTLLLSPPKKGEPALNHLHIPVEVHQTPHFHPSDRIGVIARGSGVCYEHPKATKELTENPNSDLTEIDLNEHLDFQLNAGMGWLIEEGTVHSFHTHELKPNEQPLDVIAFHPETGWGPDDNSHPMLDYTLVGENKAVRGSNSDGDYQSGGNSNEVSAPKTIVKN